MTTRFTWDPAKAARNKRSHGISFEMAREVFADPNHIVTENYHFEDEVSGATWPSEWLATWC